MVAGIPQCLAEMAAAQTFNLRGGVDLGSVYGVVSTGTNWRFLRLEGTTAWVDLREHLVNDVGHILGILRRMSGARPARRRARGSPPPGRSPR